MVVEIDSDKDNDNECENAFHRYDKVVGDMQK